MKNCITKYINTAEKHKINSYLFNGWYIDKQSKEITVLKKVYFS